MNENPAPAHSPAKKWLRRGLIALAIFASMVGLVYEASTHVVRGWLRGEAFYEGRPTSYWRCELERWTVSRPGTSPIEASDVKEMFPSHRWRCTLWYSRQSTVLEKYQRLWLSEEQTLESKVMAIFHGMNGPTLLNGDDDAEPVLRQLLADESEHIRTFARIGLKMDPRIPVE